MNNSEALKKIKELYDCYEVDYQEFQCLEEDKQIKAMKGILAKLDLDRKTDYKLDDLKIIKQIYGIYC